MQGNWKEQKEPQGLLGWEKLGYWVEDSGEEIKITHISLDGRFMHRSEFAYSPVSVFSKVEASSECPSTAAVFDHLPQ